MSSFRTGNHWGVTIVREGDSRELACEHCEADIPVGHHYAVIPGSGGLVECVGHAEYLGELQVREAAADELVAVVVNGDTVLAERICALLNIDHTPDVDYAKGAREALAEVRRRLLAAEASSMVGGANWIAMRAAGLLALQEAAAELGVAEEGKVSASPPRSAADLLTLDRIRTVLRNVLDSWIDGARANHEGLGHRGEPVGDECWNQFAPEDIRRMIDDAIGELAPGSPAHGTGR